MRGFVRLKQSHHAGQIAAYPDEVGGAADGKCADVIAVPRDPLKDITVLKEVDFVMKDGQVYKHRRRRRQQG